MSPAAWLKNACLRDPWLKLLALALAVTTWFYIDAELHGLIQPPYRSPGVAIPMPE